MLLVVSLFVAPTGSHASSSQTLYLEAPASGNNTPPLVKIIHPAWEETIQDTIDVIVKVYDPDGISNVSFGVPGQFMSPVIPWDPLIPPFYDAPRWGTTLYMGSWFIETFFEIYSQLSGGEVDRIVLTIVAVDSLGSETTLNLTVSRPDHKHPSVIFISPINGAHYVKGEEFLFRARIPNYYWPCDTSNIPENGTANPSDCDLLNMAGYTILNWTIVESLDGIQLLRETGSDRYYITGFNWPRGPRQDPWINTMDLEPGLHNLTYTMRIEMPVPGSAGEYPSKFIDNIRGAIEFYVDDPGEPTVFKVLKWNDDTITLDNPNITITGRLMHRQAAKVWVYTNPQLPGSPPSYYVVMGPILIVTNDTNRLGFFHIYFHLDPETLQELGVKMQDLVPLAFDRDLNVWYPRGYYKIDPDSYTVKLDVTYPFFQGGLYLALVSKATPTPPPAVSILEPQPGSTIEGGNVTLKWEVQGGAANITGIKIIVDDSQTISVPPSATSYSLNLQPGSHEITIMVEDAAGRYGTASTNVTVTAPTGQEAQQTQTQSQEQQQSTSSIVKAVAAAGGLVAAAGAAYAVLKLGILASR